MPRFLSGSIALAMVLLLPPVTTATDRTPAADARDPCSCGGQAGSLDAGSHNRSGRGCCCHGSSGCHCGDDHHEPHPNPMKRIRRLAKELAEQNEKLAAVVGEEIRGTWWDWSSFKVNDDIQAYLYRARLFGKALKDDDDDKRGRHDRLDGKAEFIKMMEAACVVNDGLRTTRSLKDTKAFWKDHVSEILGDLAQAYNYSNDFGVTVAKAGSAADGDVTATTRDSDRAAKFQALYGND